MRRIKIFFSTTILFSLIFSSSLQTQEVDAKKEKRKILLLQIIEENWDNLEFIPPKYKRNPNYKPPTKRELIKFRQMDVERTKERLVEILDYKISKGRVPKNVVLCVFHNFKYFGKTGEMKDDDLVEESEIRFGNYLTEYYYENIPEKISLLTESRIGGRYCVHIRLVDDIIIKTYDENSGLLKIEYDNKYYDLKIGKKIRFPMRRVVMKKEEIENWGKEYQEKIKNRWGVKLI